MSQVIKGMQIKIISPEDLAKVLKMAGQGSLLPCWQKCKLVHPFRKTVGNRYQEP